MNTITKLPTLPARQRDAHKGEFGRALLIGGSRGMHGAITLSAMACLRAGAGLVRVCIPSDVQPLVAAANPCFMTVACAQDDNGRFSQLAIERILHEAKWASVVAIGPGIGQSRELCQLIERLLAELTVPIVIDADGLNVLATIDPFRLRTRNFPTVLTPHPGEFARLTNKQIDQIQNGREDLAFDYASEHLLTILLKGQYTIVTDGNTLYRNTTGNPGMATGGSGDVLTGIVTALIAQKLEPYDATILASYIHGLAGDFAAADVGEVSLIATDIIEHLPEAFKSIGR